jgi:hypothetical protein
VKERRKARVGTISGLALLAGATAVAAIGGGRHSAFTTGALGLLAVALGHSLLDEIRRQARRESAGGWAAQDTINTVLLSGWAVAALVLTVAVDVPVRVRAVAATLFLGYALTCVVFVRLRRHTVASLPTPPTPVASAASPTPADAGQTPVP